MFKIIVHPSPTADTRTCDVSTVSKSQLLESTRMHIEDVSNGLRLLAGMLLERAVHHDHTKISHIDEFYEDFQTNFMTTKWWDMHKEIERHHLQVQGMESDGGINLIDILENIVDGVMAGMARGGKYVYQPIELELLGQAYNNTINKLLSSIEVKAVKYREARGVEGTSKI